MAYHIYTTRGIVLSARPSREADKIYAILTEDLGLVHARASGVRLEKSKLRGFLEPYSLIRVSLVRGKDQWRITSAILLSSPSASPYVARPLALVERLVAGEEHHSELFRDVESFVLHTSSNPQLESQFVARMLFHLGYLKEEDLKLEGKSLVKVINEGLRMSGLV